MTNLRVSNDITADHLLLYNYFLKVVFLCIAIMRSIVHCFYTSTLTPRVTLMLAAA